MGADRGVIGRVSDVWQRWIAALRHERVSSHGGNTDDGADHLPWATSAPGTFGDFAALRFVSRGGRKPSATSVRRFHGTATGFTEMDERDAARLCAVRCTFAT